MASTTIQLLLFTVGLILAFYTTGVTAGESCPIYKRIYGNTYIYSHTDSCRNGCCGHFPDYYCCVFSTAAVAGIILGGLVVICICVFVCVQCLKKKTQSGRVIRPVPTTNTVIFTSSSGTYPLVHHHHPFAQHIPEPPPYKRVGSPPPGYSHANSGAPPPYAAPMAPGYAVPYGDHGQHPPTYAYGQGQGWTNTASSTLAQTATSSAAPPDYTPDTPISTRAAPSRLFGYGQGKSWSTAAEATTSSTPAPSTRNDAAPSVVPPTPATEADASESRRSRLIGGRGHNWTPPTASTAATPAPPRQGWSDESLPSVSNRSTLTTSNFASRLPPLPND